MKRETLLIVAVVLLVALNFGVLVYFFAGKPSQPEPPPQHETHKMISEALKLDKVQLHELEKKMYEQKEILNQYAQDFKNIVKVYFSLLNEPSFDPAQRDLLEKKLGEIQIKRARGLFEHFQELKDLCRDDEQKQAFLELIPQLMHLTESPAGQQPGPENRPPPFDPKEDIPPPPRRN